MTDTFKLLRTSPYHIGSSPVTKPGTTAATAESAGVKTSSGTFENYLLDAVNYVNGKQQASDAVAQQIITDPDSVDVHDVTIAMAEANMSLSIAQSVIDRIVNAWNDITTTR
jgi:flagellar hook-basal body complex protein FliE